MDGLGGCCRMKKYYQLLLLIFSIVSILSFVFYKHEYDRLRKVLEVLDVFGTPVTEAGELAVVPVKDCHNGSLQFIPDLWRLYEDEIYIYSSFQTPHEKGWSMNSLAVASRDSAAARKRASCALRVGDGTADDRFEGTIEWKRMGNDSQVTAYSVMCNVPEMPGSAHLFSLYDDKSTAQLSIPLHLSPEHPKDQSTSVCVYSNDPYWQAGQVVDFILYYSALGADDFYLYHRGIGDQVVLALKAMVINRPNLSIHLAAWNRPVGSLDMTLVQHDCAWRHNGKSGPAVALPMSHYLVLPVGTNLAQFLAKIDRSKSGENLYEARIARQSLCSNPPNSEASPPLRLSRMLRNPTKDAPRTVIRWTEGPPPHHPALSEPVKVSKIDPHSAKMLTFEPCSVPADGGALEKMDEDPAVRRFLALAQKIHNKVV